MNKIKLSDRRIQIVAVIIFFSLLLGIGFLVYQDYGVSTDEPAEFTTGSIDFQRLRSGDEAKFLEDCSQIGNNCYYPALFEMVLYRIAPSGDSRDIYLTRHLFTFLFFAFSVFIFFFTGKKIFKDWKLGLLGSLFLILSPRIFAASFFNPKDIPFLSSYVIAIYTLLLFLEKKKWWTTILHSLAVGIACSIRTPGLILIPITLISYLLVLVLKKQLNWKNIRKLLFLSALFIAITAGVIYISSPILYSHPIENYIKAFNIFKNYPWNGYQLFMGKDIGSNIPWDYSIVWFAISFPIFYTILFFIGLGAVIRQVIKKSTAREWLIDHFSLLVGGACGLLPILIVIIFKSNLYTDNRQMYFCYPALLLLALFGFRTVVKIVNKITPRGWILSSLILVAGLAYPVYFMTRYHPYQNVYFNFLAGSKMSTIKQKYSLDTWAVSSKQALEYLIKNNPKGLIRIKVYDYGENSALIIPLADRERLRFYSKTPSFVITNYRYFPLDQFSEGEEYYSIRVGDADIFSVYKVSEQK